MKSKFMIAAVALFGILLIGPASYGQKNKSVFYYPVKSAIVEYVYSGATTGTESYYMDNNGRLSARYSQLSTKSFGSTTKTNQLVIQKDSIIYTIDLDKKTGVKQTFQISEKDMEKWAKTADSVYTDLGFKKTGEEVLLGKQCEIWEGMSSKVWVWKNLAIKTETNLFGKHIMEATKVEIDVSIPKSKFAIPDGITMTESTINASDPVMDSLGSDLKKGLNDLKDMFGPKKKK